MDIKQCVRIRLESSQQQDVALSYLLADRLELPPPAPDIGAAPYFFSYRGGRLELGSTLAAFSGSQHLSVDFLSPSSLYRYRTERQISQPLARAVGLKHGLRPTVCDATAGFGADAFVLAALGCSVTMIERSPVIWALLDDGIRRARCFEPLGSVFSRVSLHPGDACGFLTEPGRVYDTIYLDPMYPHRKKSALNKLRMRLLREIVGDDEDAAGLLQAARCRALVRVVVKRPAGAPCIEGSTPSFAVTAKNSRYDIYLTAHL